MKDPNLSRLLSQQLLEVIQTYNKEALDKLQAAESKKAAALGHQNGSSSSSSSGGSAVRAEGGGSSTVGRREGNAREARGAIGGWSLEDT